MVHLLHGPLAASAVAALTVAVRQVLNVNTKAKGQQSLAAISQLQFGCKTRLLPCVLRFCSVLFIRLLVTQRRSWVFSANLSTAR